ncbi:Cyclin-D1-binding protein [Quillaja saponaria]|uniref:Cyclin-D1-binding protein n=1 Tax=Quillaja saponaria TaxID=32244 RepID=A0AAD7PFY3_QUISA|nr:Cyclin-D1-binding protein [Quillaja saponaria]
MVKTEKEQLNRILSSHLNTIHETLQVFEKTASSSLDKVSWDEVIKMGDQVSKQATIVGMLWTGETPEARSIEENMAAYFNMLQGFLLLSHGSTVGAGPTLSTSILASVKQVVDSSFRLMTEPVSFYESNMKDRKLSVPQLVGAVWEACAALKKTPATNIIAIGRAMTQVAVSMKDVLREMNELKPASSDPIDEASEKTHTETDSEAHDDNSSKGDLGNDLSPEEMKVAQLAIAVVSDALSVVKELIRSITSLLKLENPNDTGNFVDSLEKLLKLCQGIGVQIDEIGACVYPPQEFPAMTASSEKIYNAIDSMLVEVEGFKRTSEAFNQACNGLRSSLRNLESELSICNTADLEAKVHNITLTN